MANILETYYSLCTPAKVYVLLSTMGVLALLYQNFASPMRYKVGTYSVKLPHNNMIFFIFKILYIVIWTFILNELCRSGWGSISWFLVLLPIILMFVIIGLLLLANM